jgi:ubiquitin-protein ligase
MRSRIRRLEADRREVAQRFGGNPHIRLIESSGQPPDRYLFEFHVDGLVPRAEGEASPGSLHRAEVFLPLDYPRCPPFCRMTTPVFHPNISPQKICIGDHWSAGESLCELVVRIAEMICFQSYNVKSPLNAQAAVWAQHNLSRLPLQAVDLKV